MIDKRLEIKIKKTKEFIDLWSKYHSLYKGALSKPSISDEDAEGFLKTQEVLSRRYSQLQESVKNNFKKAIDGQDAILELLNIESIQALSDDAMEKVNDKWRDSHSILNQILKDLEDKKREIEKVNPLIYLVNRITGRI